MNYPKAYVNFLVYFQGVRDYFQCHEVLEEEWKKDERGQRQKYWVGLIGIAVAMYHYRRGNFIGAGRSMQNAIEKLKNEKQALTNLALDYDRLMALLNDQLSAINSGKPYQSITLPVTDTQLIKHCEKLSLAKGCVFGNPSDLSDNALIHKHEMPNRDEIISKREAKKRRENK
jgi:predicted metal-dependent hydrolase